MCWGEEQGWGTLLSIPAGAQSGVREEDKARGAAGGSLAQQSPAARREGAGVLGTGLRARRARGAAGDSSPCAPGRSRTPARC